LKELSEDEKNKLEEEKLERVSGEIKRLNKLFKGIDAKTKKAVHSLIENAAFMSVTLEDLQATINKEGPVDKYQNGENQYGYKKSASVEVYNQMIKNHMGIMKQLTDLVPKKTSTSSEVVDDGFEQFVKAK
jgi:2-hydroxy-3-keto-5-methylthiopentenyl-1-phosphate phosphatase